jgi:hypothetical protein
MQKYWSYSNGQWVVGDVSTIISGSWTDSVSEISNDLTAMLQNWRGGNTTSTNRSGVSFIISNIEINPQLDDALFIGSNITPQPIPSPTFANSNPELAIQIQSVSNTHVYVQNVGSKEVALSGLTVYVDGVKVEHVSGTGTLAPGSTKDINLAVPIASGTHLIKVVTSEGTFSEFTKTFS